MQHAAYTGTTSTAGLKAFLYYSTNTSIILQTQNILLLHTHTHILNIVSINVITYI